jgi:hypothetical protein
VPRSESKNFSSTVTETVDEVPFASGGPTGVPGKPLPLGAPRKYAVATAPKSNPPINIKRFLVISFFYLAGVGDEVD